MTTSTAERTKLRLLASRMFTARLRDPEFRAHFASTSGWTPQSPIVPCEGETLFGEIYATARKVFDGGVNHVLVVPVLTWRKVESSSESSTRIDLTVLSIANRDSAVADDATGAIGVDSISHKVTMNQVCETLSTNKQWDLGQLTDEVKVQRRLCH